MIRAVIFDCFGVLYHGSTTHLEQLTPLEKRQEFADLRVASDLGYISRQEFIAGTASFTGQTPSEIERILSSEHVRNDALLAYLEKFTPDYKVGLLSNVGSHVIDQLLTASELAHYFDAVVLSSDVGMVKPYPEIFVYTAGKLGVRPEECVMIDDLEINIDGAKAAGMSGVVYHTQPQLAHDLHRLGVHHA